MDKTCQQEEIAAWFDETYDRQGFGYLRPLAAYHIFLQLLAAREGEKLLDVACGPGLLLKAAQLKGVVASGVDISERAIGIAREYAAPAEVRQGNAESTGFADDSFDLVTCIGSLERFLDRPKALAEMQRVARPDARYCIYVRNAGSPIWRIWKDWLGMRNKRGHQDAMTLQGWQALFSEAGFSVQAVYPDQWFRQKLRLLLRGLKRPNPRLPEPVARPILPLSFARGFIFILHLQGGKGEKPA